MNLNLHPPKQPVSELKTLPRRTTAENKVLRILYLLDFLFFIFKIKFGRVFQALNFNWNSNSESVLPSPRVHKSLV